MTPSQIAECDSASFTPSTEFWLLFTGILIAVAVLATIAGCVCGRYVGDELAKIAQCILCFPCSLFRFCEGGWSTNRSQSSFQMALEKYRCSDPGDVLYDMKGEGEKGRPQSRDFDRRCPSGTLSVNTAVTPKTPDVENCSYPPPTPRGSSSAWQSDPHTHANSYTGFHLEGMRSGVAPNIAVKHEMRTHSSLQERESDSLDNPLASLRNYQRQQLTQRVPPLSLSHQLSQSNKSTSSIERGPSLEEDTSAKGGEQGGDRGETYPHIDTARAMLSHRSCVSPRRMRVNDAVEEAERVFEDLRARAAAVNGPNPHPHDSCQVNIVDVANSKPGGGEWYREWPHVLSHEEGCGGVRRTRQNVHPILTHKKTAQARNNQL